uniref:Uncharacterized protein n=1 Tax=Spironucleus salmonicida TaxID=348837 RepID=V6LGH0_9EUKA|eukprot:EST43393.1 Hypothetical protein SS50377_17074 [Spironucleus salmonicida]
MTAASKSKPSSLRWCAVSKKCLHTNWKPAHSPGSRSRHSTACGRARIVSSSWRASSWTRGGGRAAPLRLSTTRGNRPSSSTACSTEASELVSSLLDIQHYKIVIYFRLSQYENKTTMKQLILKIKSIIEYFTIIGCIIQFKQNIIGFVIPKRVQNCKCKF